MADNAGKVLAVNAGETGVEWVEQSGGGGGSSYTAGTNIDIENNVISVTDAVILNDTNSGYRSNFQPSSLTVEDRNSNNNIIVSPDNININSATNNGSMSLDATGLSIDNSITGVSAKICFDEDGKLSISEDGGTTTNAIATTQDIPTPDGTTIVNNAGVWSAVGGGGSDYYVYVLSGLGSTARQALTTEIQSKGLPQYIKYATEIYSLAWKDYTSYVTANYATVDTSANSTHILEVQMNSSETEVSFLNVRYESLVAGSGITMNTAYHGNTTIAVDTSVVATKSDLNNMSVYKYEGNPSDFNTSVPSDLQTLLNNNNPPKFIDIKHTNYEIILELREYKPNDKYIRYTSTLNIPSQVMSAKQATYYSLKFEYTNNSWNGSWVMSALNTDYSLSLHDPTFILFRNGATQYPQFGEQNLVYNVSSLES